MSMVQRWFGSLLLLSALMGVAACDEDPSGPDTGTLVVAINTAGAGSDADGFGISVDGMAQGGVGSTGGTFTALGIARGQHTVQLTGVAANCTVTGGSVARIVNVPGGGTGTATFVVTCS